MPQGDGSSDDLEEEKDAKRPRSTSTIPRSGKGLEPYEYDRLMGARSVGSSSEGIGVSEGTETEEVRDEFQSGVTKDSFRGLSLALVLGKARGELAALALLRSWTLVGSSLLSAHRMVPLNS